MQSLVVPGVAVAVIVMFAIKKMQARRRYERMRISGGRKALILNIDRSR